MGTSALFALGDHHPGEAFQTTWRTNNSGSSNSRQITLPLVTGGTYNFVVRWGDGSSDTITSAGAPPPPTYAARGDYDVAITGTINGWNFSGAKMAIGASCWTSAGGARCGWATTAPTSRTPPTRR